jgi:hypothetical protein
LSGASLAAKFCIMQASGETPRLLIQNPKSNHFVADAHQWTNNINEALAFFNPIAAYRFIVENNLHDIPLVLKFVKGHGGEKTRVCESASIWV